MGDFMENYFSKFQCGFVKGYSTQQCLIALIEKWKSATDKGKSFGALLTDLSKDFDCLRHELLIAKLHAYGFSLAALVSAWKVPPRWKSCNLPSRFLLLLTS